MSVDHSKSPSSRSGSKSSSKSQSSASKKPPIVRAERFAIDRSFEVEAAMRGGNARRWAMGLMGASFILLAISVLSGLASLFFVWRQPPAEIYVSASDGGLFLAPREMTLHAVDTHFADLSAEQRSLGKEAGAQKEEKPSIDTVPTAPVAASGVPVSGVATSAEASSTSATGSP